MGEYEGRQAEPQDAAAEAFEALRAEVGQLRAVLEGLPTSGPDYSPTLAAIAKKLAAMEAHPALQITPDAFGSQLRHATEAAQHQVRGELANLLQRIYVATADLERLAGQQRTSREQVRQMAIMTMVGAVAGVIVWVGFSGPVARALPAGWGVPEKMAAATLRLDRWRAGSQLMQSADPAGWNEVVAGTQLQRANTAKLAACRAAAARLGKAQTCPVSVGTGS